MSEFVKSQIASQKLATLINVLNERSSQDEATVPRHLSLKESEVYLKAKPFYAKGLGKGYCFDRRHIDFSTLIAFGLIGDADPEVVIPAVICHDIGRYKTPEGVDNIDHASFTQRVLHMFEGERLVKKILFDAGYSQRISEEIASIIGIHDWQYLQFMNADEELRKSNPTITFNGEQRKISDLYQHQIKIIQQGIFKSPEFAAYREADRVNVPAVASFAKDYLKRSKYYENFSPTEFAILRFGYFGLLDDLTISGDITVDRLNFIRSQVKEEKMQTEVGESIARDILEGRLHDVSIGYLDLNNNMSPEAFKAFLHHSLDKEMKYAQRVGKLV